MANEVNRQAKLATSEQWSDHGNVSLQDAAIAEFQMCFGKHYCFASRIQVRDADNPETVFTLTVKPSVTYSVEGLRGGDLG